MGVTGKRSAPMEPGSWQGRLGVILGLLGSGIWVLFYVWWEPQIGSKQRRL